MKYLPSEIEINGVTYYSGLELASRELDSYNLGVAVGKKEGYEQCKHDSISKINLNTEPVEQTELSKEYDKGFTKGYEEGLEEGKKTNDYQTYKMGYEAGKKAKRYTEDDINQSHTDMNHINHLWYDKGYNAGKVEGYKEGYEDGKNHCFCRNS